jgi:hypothetical protein
MRDSDGKSRNEPLSSAAGEGGLLDPKEKKEFPAVGANSQDFVRCRRMSLNELF